MFSRAKQQKKTPKPVRVPTATYLENAALYYVQRYSATTASLRRVLQKRVMKAQHAYADFDASPCAAWIDAVIAKFTRLGYVNDEQYAEQKTQSLRRKGASARAIGAKLREKGLTVTVDSDEETELAAAKRYVKRKRLGVYRTRVTEDSANKDLAALARAGFSRSIAQSALKAALREQTDRE